MINDKFRPFKYLFSCFYRDYKFYKNIWLYENDKLTVVNVVPIIKSVTKTIKIALYCSPSFNFNFICIKLSYPVYLIRKYLVPTAAGKYVVNL